MQQRDRPAVNGCASSQSCLVDNPLGCHSDFAVCTAQSHQMIHGYNTHENVGAEKLQRKLSDVETFDRHSNLTPEFTTEALKEQPDGRFVTYNRYDELICILIRNTL